VLLPPNLRCAPKGLPSTRPSGVRSVAFFGAFGVAFSLPASPRIAKSCARIDYGYLPSPDTVDGCVAKATNLSYLETPPDAFAVSLPPPPAPDPLSTHWLKVAVASALMPMRGRRLKAPVSNRIGSPPQRCSRCLGVFPGTYGFSMRYKHRAVAVDPRPHHLIPRFRCVVGVGPRAQGGTDSPPPPPQP